MEKRIIELLGVIFRIVIREWVNDDKIKAQNLVDLEQFAEKMGLNVFESKKFELSIQEYIMEISENFLNRMDQEFENEERKEAILNQIFDDASKIITDGKKIISNIDKTENLQKSIENINIESRKDWSEKEKGVYSSCVRYISKACVEFVSKWPSFTPEVLKVIVQRQNEYSDILRKILEELQSMEKLSRTIEVTYREYEKKYRDTIIERYGKVELMGSGINNRKVKKYDISSAYVELTCFEDEFADEVELADVFVDDSIVWIGGDAGSGKTTFLRWVAICSAKNDFESVKNIRNSIPIVIGLRSIKNWPLNLNVLVNEFSKSFGYECPSGWLENIINDNKAVILLDGLDEITEDKRTEVFDFVENLSAKHPRIKILLTARNSVENELNCFCRRYEISPMNMENIKKFIFYWHRAVLYSEAIVEDRKIRALQNNLIAKITQTSSLKLLARNPLLCAMICALNFVNYEHLPENKMELYESCCKMLIDARDAERNVERPDYVFIQQLDYSKKKRILEEIAYWMIRNNQSSEQKAVVVDYVDKLLKNTNIFSQIKLEFNAELVLDYLVERSGIIREPEEGIIDFIHKTFMEYLAVKAICRNCDWNILVREACNSNWKETIVMCFNEMGETQATNILKELLKKSVEERKERYILIASLGASNAFSSDPNIKRRIDEEISHMIPPERSQIYELSQAGNYLLPFLMDSDEFSDGGRERCLELLNYLGTDDTIPDVISYINGDGDSSVKQFALEILAEYDENVLNEYGVKEQLLENVFKNIRNEELITYEFQINILYNVRIWESDIQILKSLKSLTIVCGINQDNLYYGCLDFYKYFSDVENLCLKGEIFDINILKGYHNIRVLTIETTGNLSTVMEEFGDIDEFASVEKLIIRAGKLNYFCTSDLIKMVNLTSLEIHCLDSELELNFDNIEIIKKIKKITIDVESCLALEVERKALLWKQTIDDLQVEII